jgi:hypothetical protein
MKSLNNILRMIFVIGFISIFIYTRWMVPSYPQINEDFKLSYVKSFINKTIKNEIRNYAFEATSGGSLSKSDVVKLRNAIIKFDNNLIQCKNNKKCYIKEYNNFMNHWVSQKTKVTTKYYHIQQLGLIGSLINSSMSWNY